MEDNIKSTFEFKLDTTEPTFLLGVQADNNEKFAVWIVDKDKEDTLVLSRGNDTVVDGIKEVIRVFQKFHGFETVKGECIGQ